MFILYCCLVTIMNCLVRYTSAVLYMLSFAVVAATPGSPGKPRTPFFQERLRNHPITAKKGRAQSNVAGLFDRAPVSTRQLEGALRPPFAVCAQARPPSSNSRASSSWQPHSCQPALGTPSILPPPARITRPRTDGTILSFFSSLVEARPLRTCVAVPLEALGSQRGRPVDVGS